MKQHSLTRVIRDTLRRGPIAIILILCVSGSVAFALIPPLVLEALIDRLTGKEAVSLPLILGYFAVLALAGLFDAGKEMSITVFGQKITHGVRTALCAKLTRLPAAYFTEHDPGATVSRFVNDVDTLEALFASGIVSMIADACKIIGILAVILTKSLGLGLLMLAAVPILFLFTRRVQKKMLRAQIRNRAAVGEVSNYIPETLKNIRMIHTFRKERYLEQHYDHRIEDSYKAVEQSNFYDAIYSPVVLLFSAVIVAVMVTLAATGGTMQAFFGMTVGTAVALIAYVGKAFDPIESIGMEIQSIQSAVAGVRRIREFLAESERTMPSLSPTEKDNASAVEAEDLRFGYGEDPDLFENVSFSVEPGASVTFAGRTGAGKSTLFKLFLGLYSPREGAVRIFGTAAAQIPDEEKRHLFGIVEQSFRPVPGSVADQISVYDPSVTPPAIRSAAAIAGIGETIEALPNGYDTPYADSLFSQGQRQLLSVARAVAADPKILLLDEITANLDSTTEKMLLDALHRARQQRTVLSISHRLYEANGGRVIYIGI